MPKVLLEFRARRIARRIGQDPEIFVNAALIALVTGVIGARLSHVLENLDEFTRADRSGWENLKNVFKIPELKRRVLITATAVERVSDMTSSSRRRRRSTRSGMS